ncbi:MAG: hypothetical protein CM1200mP10_15890 [Candidatus Neomarinimicrobiota bacterium]|nr:MAG: hypothetical protein CM1200mP10_15890 [Candidatus Neomarinimicrobiota bacterium]
MGSVYRHNGWQYILIPRNAGQYQLPRVQISYFNPKESLGIILEQNLYFKNYAR